MSVAVMSRVWADPPVGGSQLLVLLALADNADDDRRYAWPSVATLARKTRMSERSAQRALRELEAAGHVRLVRPGGRSGGKYRSAVYEVFPEDGRQIDAPARGDTGGSSGVTPVSPQPSKEPSTLPGGMKEGRANAQLKIAGRAIDPEVWRRTRAAIAEFNSATGKSLDALNGRRQPSDNAKRIYGRLLAYPDLSDERVAEIVHRTIESRWWGEDAPSVGVVFGPKIFETNMERGPGEAPKRSGRGASDDAWAAYVGDDGDVVDAEAEEIEGDDEVG